MGLLAAAVLRTLPLFPRTKREGGTMTFPGVPAVGRKGSHTWDARAAAVAPLISTRTHCHSRSAHGSTVAFPRRHLALPWRPPSGAAHGARRSPRCAPGAARNGGGGGPRWRRARGTSAPRAAASSPSWRGRCARGSALLRWERRCLRPYPPTPRRRGGGELLSADRKLVSVCVCVSAYFPKVDYVLGKVFFTTAAEPGELKELKSGERLFLLLKKCVPLSVSRNKGTAHCSALEAPTLTETAQVGTVCPPVCFHMLSCAENGLKMALNICPSCWHGGACSLWHWAARGLQLWGPHPTMVISFEMGIFKHVFP